MNIDSILKPFQHFGVHLGLERIEKLLANLGNPHHQVPIIHVAGTNGKGSVCAYLSSVLTEAGYRVGRYISPHLIDWTERICLNEQPISSEEFQRLLLLVQAAIRPDAESPTQFEVITAAAWLYFAQQNVDVAVMEVGLGGRLDATNVCDRPLVTVITSISREHWQVLGSTLADIAREKAGILKPGCPAVIGKLPLEARAVVERRIHELSCPAIWPEPAIELRTTETQRTQRKEERWVEYEGVEYLLPLLGDFQLWPEPAIELRTAETQRTQRKEERWVEYEGVEYPLPLLGDFQLMNSSLAIASLQFLQQQGWKIPKEAIASGMAKTIWPGRLQWTSWKNHRLLIDGAHNPAAAIALRQFVDSLGTKSITWVIGMLSTKDHADIFQVLLRPSDCLFLVPVPDNSSANPEELATLARKISPALTFVQTYPLLVNALDAAVSSTDSLTVLCGSLYLVGHFLEIAHKSL